MIKNYSAVITVNPVFQAALMATLLHTAVVPKADSVISISEPQYQPTSFVFDDNLDGTMQVSWTEGLDNPDGTLIVRVLDADLDTMPMHNVAYSAGNALGNGVVVYRGSGTSFTDNTFISSGNLYKYYGFSYNAIGIEILYKKDVPLVAKYPYPIYDGNEAIADYPNYLNNQYNIHEMNDAVRDYIDLKELLYIHEMNDAN